MDKSKTCGNCIFLMTDDGEPYYCAREDLYTLRDIGDTACDDWLFKDLGKEEEADE